MQSTVMEVGQEGSTSKAAENNATLDSLLAGLDDE